MILNEKAIDWQNPTTEVRVMLDNLQANILKGHGRDRVALVFLKFIDRPMGQTRLRAFIAQLAKNLTSAYEQLSESLHYKNQLSSGETVVRCLYLSDSGYSKLGLSAPRDPAFMGGMKSRRVLLDDPKLEDWERPYQSTIDALILIACDSELSLNKEIAVVERLSTGVAEITAIERGVALRNEKGQGIEHFGYVDGRSQPLYLKEQIEYEKNYSDGISVWDPSFALKHVLVQEPGTTTSDHLGSYLVFRKLEQNVAHFKQQEKTIAELLGLEGQSAERAGALVVGRFEDGTTVLNQYQPGGFHPVPNNFDYRADPNGVKCPFHAHTRKTNPRGDTVRAGNSLAEERSHGITRRGIPYGSETAGTYHNPQPSRGVGLLFMAFQSDIAWQFEHMQRAWVNNANFSQPSVGTDPVIGQSSGTFQIWPKKWGGPESVKYSFQSCVSMLGGEYFFAPSLATLRQL